MTDLSRNLLNAAREGLAPDADVAARVRARVAAAVGAGAVATPVAAVKATAATSTSTTGSVAVVSTKAGIGLAAKIGAALLVVGIAAVALVATRDASPSGGVAALAPTSSQSDETAATHTSTSSHEQPAPSATHDVVNGANADVTKKPAPAPRASLAREVELIDLAMVALRKQTPAAALAAIATFDKETRGRGQMAEDAAAIALEAHCRLGDDVSAKLVAFDATYPSSAQRSRIRDACRR